MQEVAKAFGIVGAIMLQRIIQSIGQAAKLCLCYTKQQYMGIIEMRFGELVFMLVTLCLWVAFISYWYYGKV